MKTVIKKWGNSPSVRIPAELMRAARMRLDQPVEMREEAGRLIIEPAKDKQYSLAELLRGITPKTLHDETDFGASVGKEIW